MHQFSVSVGVDSILSTQLIMCQKFPSIDPASNIFSTKLMVPICCYQFSSTPYVFHTKAHERNTKLQMCQHRKTKDAHSSWRYTAYLSLLLCHKIRCVLHLDLDSVQCLLHYRSQPKSGQKILHCKGSTEND